MSEVNKFSMEMLCIGTEVDGEGNIEPIFIVEFITPDGTFRYPWKHLKESVKNWVEIERMEVP